VKRSASGLCIVLLLPLFPPASRTVDSPIRKPRVKARATIADQYRPSLINNNFNHYSNNGDGSYNWFSPDNDGFEFPARLTKQMVFEDGIAWGGFHKGHQSFPGTPTPKCGGSIYFHA
jgi:hypothetical protein